VSGALSREQWTAVLDAMEDGLESFPPVVVDVAALPALGPIPSALRPRALQALQRMTDVQATLEHRRNDIGRELVALTAAGGAQARVAAAGAGKPVPHFLDRRV
jgi:hypothetical protein